MKLNDHRRLLQKLLRLPRVYKEKGHRMFCCSINFSSLCLYTEACLRELKGLIYAPKIRFTDFLI